MLFLLDRNSPAMRGCHVISDLFDGSMNEDNNLNSPLTLFLSDFPLQTQSRLTSTVDE